MNALIFDPYLDTLGGGERYSLSFGLALARLGYSVSVAWEDPSILAEAGNRFGIDLSSLSVSPESYSILRGSSLLAKYRLTKKLDLIFWVSDGSLPILFAKKNIVHFQVPFKKVKGALLKSLFIDKYVYNSKFTQSVLEKSLPASKGLVIYPPVDVEKFSSKSKEKLIISVGRFDAPLNNKRHDILIDAFSIFHSQQPEYEMVLLGGTAGDNAQIDSLRVRSGSLPVTIITNPSFDVLKDYYSRAKFYWHAAGYGIDEEEEPEKVEHFGITTVEAIASGCIPVVIAKGGQKEVVTDPRMLAIDSPDLAQKTQELIDTAEAPKGSIDQYSLKTFFENVKQVA